MELQPPPVPFFPVNSSVEDSYTGDINSPFSTVMSSDVSLIMYYAPWDFDSQLARAEVDKVARRHRREVYFAAINCWVRHGDCHRSFPKIRSFPLLLGYIGSNKGIQYRGPLQQAYINKFIVQLLRPLRRVDRPSEFYSLLANSQVSPVTQNSTIKNLTTCSQMIHCEKGSGDRLLQRVSSSSPRLLLILHGVAALPGARHSPGRDVCRRHERRRRTTPGHPATFRA